jgi:hypothetical protein
MYFQINTWQLVMLFLSCKIMKKPCSVMGSESSEGSIMVFLDVFAELQMCSSCGNKVYENDSSQAESPGSC